MLLFVYGWMREIMDVSTQRHGMYIKLTQASRILSFRDALAVLDEQLPTEIEDVEPEEIRCTGCRAILQQNIHGRARKWCSRSCENRTMRPTWKRKVAV